MSRYSCRFSIFVILLVMTVLIPTVDSRTVFVSPSGIPDGTGASWETAFTTITAGLSASSSGDEIWIRSATYNESITMQEGVALYGGFAGTETNLEERDWSVNKTVIDATGLNRSVVIGADDATLDGFTVTGGNAYYGGGVYCIDTFPRFKNCIIQSNSASYGGGIFCDTCSPEFINCTITFNAALNGGGIFCDISSPCFVNCLVTNNSTTNGGTITCHTFSSPTLTNCTIAENSRDALSTINCSHLSSPVLINCILWNRGRECVAYAESSPTFRYCCIQGGWPGEGNIDETPNFINKKDSNYHLKDDSPCIDGGLISGAPANDLDGNPRPGGDGLVDMGAYESADDLVPGPAIHIPTRIYVRSDATQDGDGTSWTTAFPTISSALEIASTSDEIWVKKGTYYETINMEPNVALYGGFAGTETNREERDWSANETVIDATGLNTSVVNGSDGANLDGFIITGGDDEYGGGVYCYQASPSLRNCLIAGNSCGIQCYHSSPIFSNCTITQNRNKGGIRCHDESSPTILNCVISDNSTVSNGGGIYTSSYSLPQFINCTIANNSAEIDGNGIYCGTAWPALYNCIVWSQSHVVVADQPSDVIIQYSYVKNGWPGEGNIEGAPLFVDAPRGDYHLQNGSPCIDRGLVSKAPLEDRDGNPRPGGDGLVDMGAYESPDDWIPGPATPIAQCWFVRSDALDGGDGTSWATAFPTITSALSVTSVSDEIWVKGGTYYEAITMEPGAAIYGGFSGIELNREERDWAVNETIINATGMVSSVVIGADYAIIDGFTITGGTARNGGGIYCSETNPTITNCIITNNKSLSAGAGLYCYYSSPVLEKCTIKANTNYDIGGGVYCQGYSSSPLFSSCIIVNNLSRYGGGLVGTMDSSLTLINSTVAGNSATDYGGGVYCSQSSIILANCTVVENTANRGCGIFCEDDSSLVVTNCILWNQGAEIVATDPNNVVVTFSAIQGGWDGDGNIAVGPGLTQMWDGNTVDVHLLSGSPCIDAGTEVPGVETDYEGDPRPSGGGWDIGADECVGDCEPGVPNPTNRIWYVTSGFEGGDGSSWDNPLGSISKALEWATQTDEIWIREGTYEEALNIETGVSLYGGFSGDETNREQRNNNTHVTTINASGLGCSAVICKDITSGTLDGLIITGGNTGVSCDCSSLIFSNCTITGNLAETYGGGIYCKDSDPSFIGCNIIENRAEFYGGGVFCGSSNPRFVGCTIARNTIYSYYNSCEGGGFFSANSSPVLTNCIITGNASYGEYGRGGGVYSIYGEPILINCIISDNLDEGFYGAACYYNYSSPSFFNCTITNNSAVDGVGGIYFYKSTAILTNCILWNHGSEIVGTQLDDITVSYCAIQGGWEGDGNIAVDPGLTQSWDGESFDFHLLSGSPCINAGTEVPAVVTDFEGDLRPSGGGWDIGVDECIGNCEPGDFTPEERVWYVAEVLKEGDGSSWESPLNSISEAINKATLYDEIWVKSATYNESVILEPGIGLYGGFAGYEKFRDQRDWKAHKTIIDSSGFECSTVICGGVSAATLDGFIITGGSSFYGGGMSCYHSASPTLVNCTISDNLAIEGGGLFCFDCEPSLTNCTITRNTVTRTDGGSYGGGIYCQCATPTLTYCTISNNHAHSYGGGLYIRSFSSPILTNCAIINNSAHIGYGIYCLQSSPQFTNSTIGGNRGDSDNSIHCYNGTPTLTNCILWNKDAEISGYNAGYANVNHSCIEGGWPGVGNIDSDPLFVDAEGGDFRLAAGSPCIDSGSFIPDIATDLAGNPRVVNIPGIGIEGSGAIDMGAFERQMPGRDEVGGLAFLKYSLLWQGDILSASPEFNETEFQLYNTWHDDTIDWRDIFTSLDIAR